MAFYIESADRPPKSAIAAEDVHPGEVIHYDAANGAEPFDGSQHTVAQIGGVADEPYSGDAVAFDEDETGTDGVYSASDNDRVVYGGDADRDRIKVRTAEDTGGNEPTPNITDGDVVGFIDTSAGTLSSTDEYHGRIVEEGYDDGESTPTTYNRSNNNFVPLGVAYRDEANAYDAPVRIEVRRDL